MRKSPLSIIRKAGIILIISTLFSTTGCSNSLSGRESSLPEQSIGTQTDSQSSEEPSYISSKKNTVVIDDIDTLTQLCNDACKKWALLYNGKDESDFSQIVATDALNTYLMNCVKNMSISGISTAEDAKYQVKSTEIKDRLATIKGVYRDSVGSYGTFIFIIENIEGGLYINDMIYDYTDTFDKLYRRDFIYDPQPDFWNDSEMYTELLEKSSVPQQSN